MSFDHLPSPHRAAKYRIDRRAGAIVCRARGGSRYRASRSPTCDRAAHRLDTLAMPDQQAGIEMPQLMKSPSQPARPRPTAARHTSPNAVRRMGLPAAVTNANHRRAAERCRARREHPARLAAAGWRARSPPSWVRSGTTDGSHGYELSIHERRGAGVEPVHSEGPDIRPDACRASSQDLARDIGRALRQRACTQSRRAAARP